MKQILHFILLLFLILLSTITQSYSQTGAPTHLFRASWDDDYFNFYGKGTDRAYTDGTRLELIEAKQKTPAFLLDRIMPEAGDSSINLYSWSITQLMFTPNNISKASFQPNDYPWSGALFASHTLYSYNEKKKMDIQTELVLGVMGPWAMAGQMQTMVHHMIHYIKPMGWDNQYRNNLLLNINITGEKQVAQYGNSIEVIAGVHAAAGTMINELAVYPIIRIGKMTPYFKGYISQYTRSKKQKVQFYFIVKPQLEWVLSNSLLEGGVLPKRSHPVDVKEGGQPEEYHPLNHVVPSFAYGPVLSLGNFSMSATQTVASAWMKGLYGNQYGNISFYYSW
ncbi:MAG TPA: lipid A deacylase LpxR family protein [Puia sp.]|nr:lipid A deacylase LpxR family protein [Puia sp.]